MLKHAATATLLLLALIAPSFTSATVLDPAWSESLWLGTGVSALTGMAWAPDGSGRLFVIAKSGAIRIIRSGPPPTLLPTPFATVTPLYTSSECGLIGIAFDPDFLNNQYVYVFATVSSSEQQILRYTAQGDIGIDKTIILSGLPTIGANHDGGGLGFGWDGKLYFSIGDLGNGTGVDDDWLSLASKVSRANPDGSIPVDNPFVDGPNGANRYIFARGFRNPFTLTFQPATGRPWINVAGTSYEQIFTLKGGEHAGWNDFENTQSGSFITPAIKYRTNGSDVQTLQFLGGTVRSGGIVTFTTTGNHLFRNGEKITIAGVTDAGFNGAFYVASIPTAMSFTVVQAGPDATSGAGTATTLNLGGAVTGGAFYDATAAPVAYRGNFFFGDYNSGRVVRATVGPGALVTSVDYFVTSSFSNTDVSVGPDGALYYVGIPGNVTRSAYIATEQALIVSNLHMFMNETRKVAFTVSLALAPAADVVVDVARTSGTGIQVVDSGASLTFTPANYALPQTVILRSVGDDDVLDEQATFSVSSAGLPSHSVQVRVLDTSGIGVAAAPGSVPGGAGVPGVPLTVQVNSGDPTRLDLAWSASCGASVTDYSVHEGTLGSWYSHDAALCTTAGATAATLLPRDGDRYFLVVPIDQHNEGSYGKDSLGIERPRSDHRCRLERNFAACP